MTGPRTANRPPGRAQLGARHAVQIWQVLAVVAILGATIPLSRFMELPSVIDRLTVENPTGYDISIEVSDGDRDGWLAMGSARRGTTSTFEEIIDQGVVWTFRFGAQAEDGGELRVTRAQLVRDGWRFRIPESVGEELEAQGAPFPP